MKVETGKAVKPWSCNFVGCSKKITKGQEYFLWHLSGSALRQHQDHGQPVANPATKVTKKKATTKKVAKKVSRKGKGGKK